MEVMSALNSQQVTKNSKSDDSKTEKGDSKFSDLMKQVFGNEDSQKTTVNQIEEETTQAGVNFVFHCDGEGEICDENIINKDESLDDYIDDGTLNLASLQYQFQNTQETIGMPQEVTKVTEKSEEKSEITQKASEIPQQIINQGLSSIIQESNTLIQGISVVTEDTNTITQDITTKANENKIVGNDFIKQTTDVADKEIIDLDSVMNEFQNILNEISGINEVTESAHNSERNINSKIINQTTEDNEITLLKDIENSVKKIISQISKSEKIHTSKIVKQDVSKVVNEQNNQEVDGSIRQQANEDISQHINYLQDEVGSLVSKVSEFVSNENNITDSKIQEIINVLEGNSGNDHSNITKEFNEYDTIKNLQNRMQNKVEFTSNIDNEVNQVKIVEEKLISVIKELKVIETKLFTTQNKNTLTNYNSFTTYNEQAVPIKDFSRINRIFDLQEVNSVEIQSEEFIAKEKNTNSRNLSTKALDFNIDETNKGNKFVDKPMNETSSKSENLRLNNLSGISRDESVKGNFSVIGDEEKNQLEQVDSKLENLSIFNTTPSRVINDSTVNNSQVQVGAQIENFDEVIKELQVKTDGIKNNEEMTMSVKLKPRELGELNIQIEKKDNEMVAKLIVNSNETKELIQKNIHLIKESLENTNVKIIEVNVDDKSNFASEFSFNSQSEESSRNNEFYNEESGHGRKSEEDNNEETYKEEDKSILSKVAETNSDSKINILM